jgi:hypothetical protein
VRDVAAHLLDTTLRKVATIVTAIYRHRRADRDCRGTDTAGQLAQCRGCAIRPATEHSAACGPARNYRRLGSRARGGVAAPRPRDLGGELGGRGRIGELDGHRARIHRAVASPDADPRCRWRAASAGTAVARSVARHLGACPAGGVRGS